MKNYTKRSAKPGAKGFTLIELLVVIAIIAVLLAILMPAMRKIKEIARETACKSNLKNVGLAVQMYLDDYERKIPDTQSSSGFLWFESDGHTYLRPGSGDGTYWGTFYKDYIRGQTKIFACPSFRNTSNTRLTYRDIGPKQSDWDFESQHAAFGLNHHKRARGRNTETIYRLSEFIYCLDHHAQRQDGWTLDSLHNNNTPGSMNLTRYRQGGVFLVFYRQIFRHNVRYPDPDRTGGRTNVLWLDGHVTHIEETTGDDVPLSWYTGDKEDRQ